MEKQKVKFWLGITAISTIGPVRFKKIINYFADPADFFRASLGDLLAAGISQQASEQILIERNQLNLDALLEQVEWEEIKIVTFLDEEYPAILKEIYDFPPLLYVRGNLRADEGSIVAVVGARQPTNYGQDITTQLATALANAGVTIVSGLARGIDSIAHSAASKAGGRTIAVLGSGLDWRSIYPSENRRLAEEIIAAGGAVISEFPCGSPPHRQHFPQRNRIIAGLSLGTLVVEAAEGSGALITAKCALDYNREVWAVPGSIYSPLSFGPNNLLKQGAKVVTSANDILESLNLNLIKEIKLEVKVTAEGPEEEALLPLLSQEPVHIDQLILTSGLSREAVNSALVIMEIKGKIKDIGGKRYIINCR